MMKNILNLAALLVLLAPMGAQTTPITSAAAGLPAPETTIDFGINLFNGQIITTEFAGVTFGTSGSGWTYKTATQAPPNIVDGHLTTPADHTIAEFSVLFDTAVFEAMFNFKAFTGPQHIWTMSSWFEGVLVETIDFSNVSSQGLFYGFENSLFDEIRFENHNSGAGFEFDNLQFSSISEPGTLALLGLGLVGVGFGRRRKKA